MMDRREREVRQIERRLSRAQRYNSIGAAAEIYLGIGSTNNTSQHHHQQHHHHHYPTTDYSKLGYEQGVHAANMRRRVGSSYARSGSMGTVLSGVDPLRAHSHQPASSSSRPPYDSSLYSVGSSTTTATATTTTTQTPPKSRQPPRRRVGSASGSGGGQLLSRTTTTVRKKKPSPASSSSPSPARHRYDEWNGTTSTTNGTHVLNSDPADQLQSFYTNTIKEATGNYTTTTSSRHNDDDVTRTSASIQYRHTEAMDVSSSSLHSSASSSSLRRRGFSVRSSMIPITIPPPVESLSLHQQQQEQRRSSSTLTDSLHSMRLSSNTTSSGSSSSGVSGGVSNSSSNNTPSYGRRSRNGGTKKVHKPMKSAFISDDTYDEDDAHRYGYDDDDDEEEEVDDVDDNHRLVVRGSSAGRNNKTTATTEKKKKKKSTTKTAVAAAGAGNDDRLTDYYRRHDINDEYDDDDDEVFIRRRPDQQQQHQQLPNSTSMISVSDRKFKWPEPRPDGRFRALIGLRNLGNTCFMNSCLQCICSMPPLMEYLSTGAYRVDVNRKSRIKGRLASAFADLVTRLRHGRDGEVERPSQVKDTVSLIAPQFSGYGQQDVQEFLQFLLDGLHDDLNRVVRKPKYEEIKDLPHEDDAAKSDRWWRNYTDRNDSTISDLFCGQLKSQVECSVCGNVSTVFDPTWDISVPIPSSSSSSSSHKKNKLGRLFSSSSSSVTLDDCFRAYMSEERLTGNDQYYCSKCKKHRDCTKALALYRLPYILIVTLKRFSSGSGGGFAFRRSKITTRVDFPINGLDLSEFSPRDREAKYDLFGIANHSGGLGGGHYTAYARVGQQQWAYFNDSRAHMVSEDNLVSSEAYVLFYMRRE